MTHNDDGLQTMTDPNSSGELKHTQICRAYTQVLELIASLYNWLLQPEAQTNWNFDYSRSSAHRKCKADQVADQHPHGFPYNMWIHLCLDKQKFSA